MPLQLAWAVGLRRSVPRLLMWPAVAISARLDAAQTPQRPNVAQVSCPVCLLHGEESLANWRCAVQRRQQGSSLVLSPTLACGVTSSRRWPVRSNQNAERRDLLFSSRVQQHTSGETEPASRTTAIAMAQCLCSHKGSLTLSTSSVRSGEASMAGLCRICFFKSLQSALQDLPSSTEVHLGATPSTESCQANVLMLSRAGFAAGTALRVPACPAIQRRPAAFSIQCVEPYPCGRRLPHERHTGQLTACLQTSMEQHEVQRIFAASEGRTARCRLNPAFGCPLQGAVPWHQHRQVSSGAVQAGGVGHRLLGGTDRAADGARAAAHSTPAGPPQGLCVHARPHEGAAFGSPCSSRRDLQQHGHRTIFAVMTCHFRLKAICHVSG